MNESLLVLNLELMKRKTERIVYCQSSVKVKLRVSINKCSQIKLISIIVSLIALILSSTLSVKGFSRNHKL